jgi:hypothetical protein
LKDVGYLEKIREPFVKEEKERQGEPSATAVRDDESRSDWVHALDVPPPLLFSFADLVAKMGCSALMDAIEWLLSITIDSDLGGGGNRAVPGAVELLQLVLDLTQTDLRALWPVVVAPLLANRARFWANLTVKRLERAPNEQVISCSWAFTSRPFCAWPVCADRE